MKRIVILGGGFGGAACARELEKKAGRLGLEVVLINKENYFVFTPLLVEAGTGGLEPRHTVVPLRDFLTGTRLLTAKVTGLDMQSKTVQYQVAGQQRVDAIAYDHLVVALGSVTRLPDVPGLAEFGYEMKSLADAVFLRDHAIQLLEIAEAEPDAAARRALLNIVVVGANFSGVEVAGELFVFFREAARKYQNVKPRECNVTLIEIADRILPMLDLELAEYALVSMRKRGIDIRLQTSVAEIREDHIVLQDERQAAANQSRRGSLASSSADAVQTPVGATDAGGANEFSGATAAGAGHGVNGGLYSPAGHDWAAGETSAGKAATADTTAGAQADGQEVIPTRTVIWCAGIKPNPIARELGLPCDERGTVLCERDLSVTGLSGVWAIGDVAKNPDGHGGFFPPTAQHALRMGKHLARNIIAVESGGTARPCEIITQGYLAALGCRTAVARVFGLKISGFPAWFLWRSVYLLKMPGLGRKTRVALDWTISLLFPRQIVQLGVHKPEK